MTRGTRVTVFALVTLCSLWVAGCTSNPSGVNTQDPLSATTTTPFASASSATVTSATASETSATSSLLSSAPTTPTAKSSPSTSSPTPLSSSAPPPPKTTAAADPEAANRAAIEAVWTKYWVTSLGLSKVPAADRLVVMKTVAVQSPQLW